MDLLRKAHNLSRAHHELRPPHSGSNRRLEAILGEMEEVRLTSGVGSAFLQGNGDC